MAGMKAAPPNQKPARRPVGVRVSKTMMAPASPASNTPNSKKRERSFIFPVHLAAVVGSGDILVAAKLTTDQAKRRRRYLVVEKPGN